MSNQSKKKKGDDPIKFLKDKVYPELYDALVKLIDTIIQTDEINKHNERLKRKKVFDKVEQRRVEKDRLRQELGSEYSSSDEESLDFGDLGLEKEEIQKILNEQKKGSDDEDDDKEDSNNHKNSKQKKADQQAAVEKKKKDLGMIEENEEEEENPKDVSNELEQRKQFLQDQRENRAFNPLRFLGEKLKEVHKQKKK